MRIKAGSVVQLMDDYGFFLKAGKTGIVEKIIDKGADQSLAGFNVGKTTEPYLKISGFSNSIPVSKVNLLVS